MKQICIFVMMLAIISTASATTENITIIDPANDNPIINSDFDVRVYVNDTDVKTVQARITGFAWVSLEQATSMEWTARFKIADYQDGSATLTAKYQRTGESTWYYVPATTLITIQKPASTIQYGTARFTVKDVNNNLIQGVTVQPSGNVSGSDGVITIGNQPLNQQINFTFTKTDYIQAYYLLTFTTNSTVSQTITLTKIKPDLKKLRVSGYEQYVEANSMFYLKVKDDITGELINGAQVLTFYGNVVQSIPGNVTNGRITVSFINAGNYELIIEKEGYEDWSDTITVIAPKVTATETPTPTPTPAPTPKEKYYPDANLKLTEDEYGAWLQRQDEIRRNQTIANNTIPTIIQQPQKESEYPWTLIGFGLVAIGIVAYKYSKYNKGYTINLNKFDPDVIEHLSTPTPTGIKIKCDLCEWSTTIDEDIDKTVQDSILTAHKNKKHAATAS